MSAPAHRSELDDAAKAIALFAIDPAAVGGLVLRAPPGPPRDRLCQALRALLPEGAPLVRVPHHITEDRLLGGLSLAATLNAGRVMTERGVLAGAHGGAVIVSMAERIASNVTSHLCGALDRGVIAIERDGIAASFECRIGVLALDEGIGDERPPHALCDRAAFQIDLTSVDPRAIVQDAADAAQVARARRLLPQVTIGGDAVAALCEAAWALGAFSLRAPLLAVRVARAHAALHGRAAVDEEDAGVGARLVLGPRATRMPAPEAIDEDEEDEEDEEDDAIEPPPESPESASDAPLNGDRSLDEIVLQAAKSGIPQGLLETLLGGREPKSARRSDGRSGARAASMQHGRPAGARAGSPASGERLNLVETLRAAAPWQRLRRDSRAPCTRRVEVRKEDFRMTRFVQRAETSVIFAVDASGSAALQRLAEAKGAVEQVLSDCYVRRDHVALVAFRGREATLLLSPTRSLARVKRSLAALAGGGATPLAAGIDAALALALGARKQGKTPILVLMTDGRANIARDGREGAAAGTSDALASARSVRAAGIRTLFLDTAPRPRAEARALSIELGARYLPLPYLDAAGISRQVQRLAAEPS